MCPIGSPDLDQAVAETVRVLTPHESADWQRRAGTLNWSCWKTAAHVAHDLLAYAGQLAAQPDSAYLPFDLVVRDDASPRDLLRIVAGAGRLLSTALATSDPSVRAWHWGPTDPSGFAALGVNETLVHTHDITEGLGIRWRPPESLCSAVLARLFPDAPAGDPVHVLLWSTGRTGSRPAEWCMRRLRVIHCGV
jgi:hypothetical protein